MAFIKLSWRKRNTINYSHFSAQQKVCTVMFALGCCTTDCCLFSPRCHVSRWMTSVWLQSPTLGPSQCCGSLLSSGSLSCRRKASKQGIHVLIITLPPAPHPLPPSPLTVPMATLPITTRAQYCRWRSWRVSAANRSASNSSANQTRAEFSSWTCCLVVWQPKMENWGTMTKYWPSMDTIWGTVHLRVLPRSYRYLKGHVH